MPNYNMQKLQIDRNGNYRDVNGNIITRKGLALSGSAWKYLAGKYGKDYANQVSRNTRNGATYQNGLWYSSDGKALKGWTPRRNIQNKNQLQPQEEAPESIGGKVFKFIGDKTGWYHAKAGASDLVGTLGYFIPGVGNAMSAGDAFNAARRGDWGEAAMNAVFALPFIGNIGRGLKTGLLAAKFTRAANRVNKGIKVINKINKPANYAMNASLVYLVPTIGKSLYGGYQDVKQAKQLMQPLTSLIAYAKLNGASEEDIKNALGEDYNNFKTMTSRDNSFMGNLGTMWDLMQ